tara:strand:+ start:301 stop:510 length:210 start_codon:yes stop_codon:yes gene_type:complete
MNWEQELQLELPDLEMAMQMVHNAWQSSDEEHALVEVPPQLQHLTQDQWETVGELLSWVQYQQYHSRIH